MYTFALEFWKGKTSMLSNIFNVLNVSKVKAMMVMLAVLFVSANNVLAEEAHDAHGEKEGFNAGETIINHVIDAHEMHIVGNFSIPLPLIIYTEKGLDVFMSSEFHHGHTPYVSPKTGYTYTMHHGQLTVEGNPKIYDFSITKNVVGMFLCLIIMFWLFVGAAKGYKRNQGQAPKGVQAVVEPLVLFIRDEVAKPSIGKRYEIFMPYLLSIFFFILILNFLGLIPFLGGMNVTGNIAVTMVLALFTFIITSFRANGGYWKHIVAPPGVPLWLLPIMLPIEIIGVISKPIVLMLRLFANITAGHIIILAFTSLIFIFAESKGVGAGYGISVMSVLFSVFMNVLELLVAFLQAYVFTLLSALYFGQAVEEAH